jgi:hypothetical protein
MIKIEDIKAFWICRYTDHLRYAATPEDECFRYCKGLCDVDGKDCVVREFVYNPNYRQKYPTIANNLKNCQMFDTDYNDSDLPDKI